MKTNPDIIATEFDGELVLLSVETGTYFGIDGSGVRIWELLSTGAELDQVGAKIAAEFDVSFEQAKADTVAFCKQLREHKLVDETA